ncbi:hypothetical protein PR048_023254 [Dryococelus australis]|uniref:Uncharacterized protein n=1 Tax=Dryococelus australis TaxID=614101 RepID=A0ABQ9GTK0_9NEOP|nr:hypothetical protein PR048_023254 [Dryococelus australis]
MREPREYPLTTVNVHKIGLIQIAGLTPPRIKHFSAWWEVIGVMIRPPREPTINMLVAPDAILLAGAARGRGINVCFISVHLEYCVPQLSVHWLLLQCYTSGQACCEMFAIRCAANWVVSHPAMNDESLYQGRTQEGEAIRPFGITLLQRGPRTAVAERLARSPSTKANRVQSPAESLDVGKWESCRTMPLVGGFSRASPVSHTPSFRSCSKFASITFLGSQDLAVKSRPNLFTHSLFTQTRPKEIVLSIRVGIPHVGIVPDDADGRRVFSSSRFPCPCIPALLHTPYSPRFTLIGSHDLDFNNFPHLFTIYLHKFENTISHGSKIVHVFFLKKKKTNGAAVVKWLARSPPATASSPAGFPDFRMWESYQAMPLISGFYRGSPVSPALSFRQCSILAFITLIGSQDLAVKAAQISSLT